MKSYVCVLALVLAFTAGSTLAEVVWTGDMTDLSGWIEDSDLSAAAEDGDQGGIYIVPEGFQMNSWEPTSATGWTGIWADTGVTIQAETVYTLTVTMESYINEGTPAGLAVTLQLQDASSDPWDTIVTDAPFVANGSRDDFVIAFDTIGTNNASMVGNQLGVNILPDWWNNILLTAASLEEVVSTPIASTPTPAVDLLPFDNLNTVGTEGASGVDVDLAWKTALNDAQTAPNPDVVNHHLYLMETTEGHFHDPNYVHDFSGVTAIVIPAGSPVDPNASYPMTGLDHDMAYVWKVEDELTGSIFLPGTIWSFETFNILPVIFDEPEDILVGADGIAVFDIYAESLTPDETYQWYLSDDAVVGSDTLLTDETATTLTLTGITVADVGKHAYCIVTNAAGTTTSRLALIEFERLMAQWKFQNNMDDEAATYIGSMADPNYTTGVDGAFAMKFEADGEFVEIAGSESDFNNYHLGLTVSAWVKTSNTDWNTIVAKQNRDGDVWNGWVLNNDDLGNVTLDFRGIGYVYGTTNIADGQWHQVTATVDAGVARLYIDGRLDAEADFSEYITLNDPLYEGSSAYDAIPMSDRPITIGAEDTNGLTTMDGIIDELYIYNYALSYNEVIDDYNVLAIIPIEDGGVCIAENYSPAADLSGPAGVPDCVIDIYDFAEIALGWLSSGLYPIAP